MADQEEKQNAALTKVTDATNQGAPLPQRPAPNKAHVMEAGVPNDRGVPSLCTPPMQASNEVPIEPRSPRFDNNSQEKELTALCKTIEDQLSTTRDALLSLLQTAQQHSEVLADSVVQNSNMLAVLRESLPRVLAICAASPMRRAEPMPHARERSYDFSENRHLHQVDNMVSMLQNPSAVQVSKSSRPKSTSDFGDDDNGRPFDLCLGPLDLMDGESADHHGKATGIPVRTNHVESI
eukprot:gnl/TRDRNA2_/TRDRNA2_137209_c1_seq1.p1 gnl/TRDRNA2_/TRDRNA2_137209_c1~~gnl/TRDRNA2_/TRDRNA2_137209_c1_seq1.p1  ORF type:complete len:246 (+),score=29.91 gnl/TRDRNA2_/TRDRNA2_137209_c1_seq1:28-738(+)